MDFSTGGEGEQERDRAADLGKNYSIRTDKRAYFGTGSAISDRRIPARFQIEKRLGWQDLYHAEDLLIGHESFGSAISITPNQLGEAQFRCRHPDNAPLAVFGRA